MENLRSRHLVLAVATGVSLTLWSCGPSTPVQPGAMGEGRFAYVCDAGDYFEAGEYACALAEDEPEIPFNFILGTQIDLRFELNDEYDTTNYRIEPVAPGIVSQSGGGFSADAEGVVALLALDLSDGTVLDFVHVGVYEPAGVTIENENSPSPLESVSVGDHRFFLAAPINSAGAILLGPVGTFWETSNPEVLSLYSSPWSCEDCETLSGPRVEVVGEAPGTAQITASIPAYEVSATVNVQVTEASR